MSSHPNEAYTAGFYKDDGFDFELRNVLGHAVHGASDVGEVLAAVASVSDGDHEGWYAAWFDLGTRLTVQAAAARASGHNRTAAAAYLRAAVYLGVATNSVDGLKDESVLLPTFHAHRAAWDSFIDTTALSTERIEIPYEGTTLPGYIVRPSADGAARRTLILSNGSDGSLASLWANGGVGAIERGYNVVLFDGPGQQSMLFDRGTAFRPDWEAVITPVVDFLLERSDVDGAQLALYGISQGGYWVPRALAFEHRIAAAIADPGVVDVSTSWTSNIPKSLMKLVAEGKSDSFNSEMGLAMKFSPGTRRTWGFRSRPFAHDSYFATISAVLAYNLEDVAGSISTPLLITSPEGEQFWPGQSQRLADLVPNHATLVAFSAAEGASQHCQPLARALTDERMFDWLDDQLA